MSPVLMTLKLAERQLPGYVYLKIFSCENGNIQLYLLNKQVRIMGL